MEKYEYSVIGVCEQIHGFIKGTGDCPGFSFKELRKLIRWLDWRINQAWDKSKSDDEYDFAVLQLAHITLRMSKYHIVDWEQQ